MKIGDKVRIVKPGHFTPQAAWGQIGVIVGQDRTFPELWEVRGEWAAWASLWAEDELEVVEEAEKAEAAA